MRGEHRTPPCKPSLVGGPSPRARGTRAAEPRGLAELWSIPACAGNTPSSVCTHRPEAGPSPRARGTRPRWTANGILARSIPACAGNTSHLGLLIACLPVHPRVRGEHILRASRSPRIPGPSPRARGTPQVHDVRGCDWRSIPACAGNTFLSGLMSINPNGPSPRARGTRCLCPAVTAIDCGPSPRARGTRRHTQLPS